MKRTVLIVDDSLTVRMDLAEAFTTAGFRPLLAESVSSAREVLSRTRMDVIVLDVVLPDGNGVDLLDEIRSTPDGAAVPIVMLSTEAEVKDRIRGIRTGADEYVGKPYDAGYLVAKVEELVHSGPREDARAILVIDDSATYRGALREAFSAAGFSVVEAASGEEGLRLAGTHRPDAVVVDGMLPGMDGPTVIRHLRLDAALRDIPCVLLTGSEARHVELHALDAGADAFVRKEDDLGIVLARVNAVLRASSVRPKGTHEMKSLRAPKKILAVDDSLTYLHGLADALKDEGYDVILAHSGEEALDLLAVQPVDCILLDLLMPGLSGQETCQRIKAAPAVRDIPLIMLTALEDRQAMIQGLGAGADDYLSKSSELEVLKARVRAQIRRKQFEDESRRVREELLGKEIEAAEARAARQVAEAKAILADELERKNSELEAFSYSVSHDLRAPLRAIDGFSRLVLEDFSDRLDPRGLGYLQRVCAAAQRMSELIDDLLELSRVGRAELRRSPINLSDIARAVVADLRVSSERTVHVDVDEGLEAHADNRLMRIVLENLLGNSWKFTANVTAPRVHVGRDDQGRGPVFFVRDNGAGFDMKYVEKLFRPFQRLHSAAEFGGTGVGLATVYRIVDRHGGRVWAEAGIGHGATFYFTIPPPGESGRL